MRTEYYLIEKATGRKWSYYSKCRGIRIDWFNGKAAVTRAINKHKLELGTYEIVPVADYKPRMVERVNLMSGEKYMEDINTPACCSPASELYWSM